MKRSITLLTLFLGLNLTIAQNLKPIVYKDGEQKLSGLVTSNAGKKLPGVLILPAWKGIDNEAKNAATELQKQGYIAFVADIYGEGNIPADNAAAAKIAGSYKQNYKAYQQRISVALEELKKQGANPEKNSCNWLLFRWNRRFGNGKSRISSFRSSFHSRWIGKR